MREPRWSLAYPGEALRLTRAHWYMDKVELGHLSRPFLLFTWHFDWMTGGILVPWPGMESVPPCSGSAESLTTGPPGKFSDPSFLFGLSICLGFMFWSVLLLELYLNLWMRNDHVFRNSWSKNCLWFKGKGFYESLKVRFRHLARQLCYCFLHVYGVQIHHDVGTAS